MSVTFPLSQAALSALCSESIEQLGIAGAQIALAVGNDVLHAEAGVANVELGAPVTGDTLFQIGSTTKLYTAVLVMQLVDAGAVDIDRPVASYLPGVRLAPGDEWRAITPRQLMAMMSGLDNGPYIDMGRSDDSVARSVQQLAEIPLVFAPGSAYGYSNASTNVSGLLVETLTGRCWDEALRDRLLEPAALSHSVSLFDELPYHRVAVGTLPGVEAATRPWCFNRGAGPSGSSLAASASDLVRFGRIMLRGGLAADGTRILSESAVETMHAVQVDVPARVFADHWCVGPYKKVWGGVEVFGHSGTTQNGSTLLVWVPEHELVVATTVNTPHRGYPFADAVLDAVLRDGLGVPKPARPVPQADMHVDPAPYLGRYEAWGLGYEVSYEDGTLLLTAERAANYSPLGSDEPETLRTPLLPIAPHRFLPADDAVTWHHTWDFAFTLGADGRASLLHNGSFAARRVA